LNGYENLSDSELASRAAASGDEDAFNEIVRRFSPRVFRFAARFFRQHTLIEEAAQEVFLKIFMQIGSYDGRGSLEGWITRITINTCINLVRSAKRQPAELTISDLTDEETAWLEVKIFDASAAHRQTEEDRLVAADLVRRVMETLPPDDALVLTLIDADGASIKETAALTGWSESNVKVKAFRARRRMREAVEKLLKFKEDRLGKI
jgi:RNA polymerase sigma-70 factor (ECF subfamily)